MPQPSVSAFLIGKTPAVGDFFSRGLAPAAARAWDDWVAAEVQGLYEALGAGFEPCHECAPPLKFVLGGEALGGWMAGAMAPSVDSAGRRFLLAAGLGGLTLSQAGALGVATAGSAEAALYDIIGEQLAPDAGLERVEAAVPVEGARWAAERLAVSITAGALWCEPLDLFIPIRGLQPGALLPWMMAVSGAMELAS